MPNFSSSSRTPYPRRSCNGTSNAFTGKLSRLRIILLKNRQNLYSCSREHTKFLLKTTTKIAINKLMKKRDINSFVVRLSFAKVVDWGFFFFFFLADVFGRWVGPQHKCLQAVAAHWSFVAKRRLRLRAMAASRGSSSSTNGLLPASLSGRNHPDMEAGARVGLETEFDDDAAAANDVPSTTDPFDIANTKNAPPETLKRWRVRLLSNTTFQFKRITMPAMPMPMPMPMRNVLCFCFWILFFWDSNSFTSINYWQCRRNCSYNNS